MLERPASCGVLDAKQPELQAVREAKRLRDQRTHPERPGPNVTANLVEPANEYHYDCCGAGCKSATVTVTAACSD